MEQEREGGRRARGGEGGEGRVIKEYRNIKVTKIQKNFYQPVAFNNTVQLQNKDHLPGTILIE